MSPSGTSPSTRSATSSRMREAITAPRLWMPTIAILSPSLRSTISWAMRTRVRLMSSLSRTTLPFKPLLPGLAGPG